MGSGKLFQFNRSCLCPRSHSSDAPPPPPLWQKKASMGVLCLNRKNVFVEEDRRCSRTMRRTRNRSGSQSGEAIHQPEPSSWSDKLIKDRQAVVDVGRKGCRRISICLVNHPTFSLNWTKGAGGAGYISHKSVYRSRKWWKNTNDCHPEWPEGPADVNYSASYDDTSLCQRHFPSAMSLCIFSLFDPGNCWARASVFWCSVVCSGARLRHSPCLLALGHNPYPLSVIAL